MGQNEQDGGAAAEPSQQAREAAEEWRFIECRHCSEYEGDFVADLAADFQRIRAQCEADKQAAIDAARKDEREKCADYIEGKGGVIPGANVFAPLVSGNNQPCMSGDYRDRLIPHLRRRFDDASRDLAAAIRAGEQGR